MFDFPPDENRRCKNFYELALRQSDTYNMTWRTEEILNFKFEKLTNAECFSLLSQPNIKYEFITGSDNTRMTHGLEPFQVDEAFYVSTK